MTKKASKVPRITYRFGFFDPITLDQSLNLNLSPLTPANIQVYKLIFSYDSLYNQE